MSEEQNIKEQSEDQRPLTTDNIEKSADDFSIFTEENKTIAEETIRHSKPNIQHNKESMEVHQHGHVRHEKKWKEYLFQFFMLFLAVFCSFLAEYQLEHVIENKREKQYMISLVRDLELDTTQLASIKNIRLSNIARIDSTISYFATHTSKAFTLRQFKLTGIELRSFYQNSGTLDQLKNAGGLRLIRNRDIVDSIEAYDNQIKRMILRDKYEIDVIYDYNKTRDKIFDGHVIAKIHADTALFNKPPPAMETLIDTDPTYVGPFLNELLSCRNIVRANIVLQATIVKKAENLIKLIKAEYYLK